MLTPLRIRGCSFLRSTPDLDLPSTCLIQKWPSASENPVNQLLLPKFEVSNRLSGILKEHLLFIIFIKLLNVLFLVVLSLPCIKFIII